MPPGLSPAQVADALAATTPHPPPPWRMDGLWLWSVYPVHRQAAAAILPKPLRPLWLPTGRTLAWSLIGQYGGSSTLHYSEAASGLVLRIGPRPAIWIAGLVVDLPASVAGGRNNWHLPKELATISWPRRGGRRASADQDQRLLLSFEGVPASVPGLPLRFGVDVLVVHEGQVRRIPASFGGHIGVTRHVRPFVPASGPWAALGVSGYSISGLGRGIAEFGALEEA